MVLHLPRAILRASSVRLHRKTASIHLVRADLVLQKSSTATKYSQPGVTSFADLIIGRHWARAGLVGCAHCWSDRSPCIPSRTLSGPRRPSRYSRARVLRARRPAQGGTCWGGEQSPFLPQPSRARGTHPHAIVATKRKPTGMVGKSAAAAGALYWELVA